METTVAVDSPGSHVYHVPENPHRYNDQLDPSNLDRYNVCSESQKVLYEPTAYAIPIITSCGQLQETMECDHAYAVLEEPKP